MAQASVREAINLLITEGFLVKDAGRSARVPRYTQSDIDRIYQVRGALEALAARLAAEARADLTEPKKRSTGCPARRTPARSVAYRQRPRVPSSTGSGIGEPFAGDMLRRLLEPLFSFAMLRMIETREATSAWAPDLPRHREILYLIRDGNPAVAAAFVEHSVGCFAAPPALYGLPTRPRVDVRGSDMPDRSIRVALIAGGMYEGLYGRIPDFERKHGVRVEVAFTGTHPEINAPLRV